MYYKDFKIDLEYKLEYETNNLKSIREIIAKKFEVTDLQLIGTYPQSFSSTRLEYYSSREDTLYYALWDRYSYKLNIETKRIDASLRSRMANRERLKREYEDKRLNECMILAKKTTPWLFY